MNKKRELKTVTLTINLAIIIFELFGFINVFRSIGLNAFLYYTENSNLILLISSIMLCVYLIGDLKGKKFKVPKWFSAFRLTGVLSVTVTFLVVLFILTPEFDNGFYGAFIENSMKYHHLLCPLLGMISFIFYEKYEFKKYDNLKSLIFTIIYSAILVPLNIFKVVDGPYPFLKVHGANLLKSAITSSLILIGTIILSYILVILNKKFCVKKIETLK